MKRKAPGRTRFGQGIDRQPREKDWCPAFFAARGVAPCSGGSMLWNGVQSGSDDGRVSCLAPLGSREPPVQVPPAGNEAPAGPIRGGGPFGQPARSLPFERSGQHDGCLGFETALGRVYAAQDQGATWSNKGLSRLHHKGSSQFHGGGPHWPRLSPF